MSATLIPPAPTRPSEIDSVAGASPRQLARTAGALYLINIVLGAFAISIVPAIIGASSDPGERWRAASAALRMRSMHVEAVG